MIFEIELELYSFQLRSLTLKAHCRRFKPDFIYCYANTNKNIDSLSIIKTEESHIIFLFDEEKYPKY